MLSSLLTLALAAAAATAPAPAGKATRILSPRAFPGWQTHNVAFPSVLVDPASGRYRMFYAGSPAASVNSSTWEQWATLTAVSRDGLDWTFPDDYEPILVPHRFREGELADPAALGSRFDSVAAFGASALREASGYRLWYTGWSGAYGPAERGAAPEVGFAIGVATSADGAVWTRQAGDAGAGAVLSPGAAGEPDAMGAGQPSVVRDGDTLRMWYECFDGKRWRICAATSSDGRAWTKQGVALDAGPEGAPDALGARNPVAVRRGDAWELWYQGHGAASPHFRVLRATSPDGRAWTRAGAVALHPEAAVAGDERVHVDTVIPLPGGASRVFFAREVTARKNTPYGPVTQRRYHVYSEVVR